VVGHRKETSEKFTDEICRNLSRTKVKCEKLYLIGKCDKTCFDTGKIPISTRNQFVEVTLIGKLELFEIIKLYFSL